MPTAPPAIHTAPAPAPTVPGAVTFTPAEHGVIVGGSIPVEMHGFYATSAGVDGTVYVKGPYLLTRDIVDGSWSLQAEVEEGGSGV